MSSKLTEHVRPTLRQRPAKSSTPAQSYDTSKQAATTAVSALKAPALCGLDESGNLSQRDMTNRVQFSGVSMSGRVQSSLDIEVLPHGRRTGRLGKRKSPAQKKHGEDVRSQARKGALLSAQQAGATGNFKSVDSEFNNFLIPVIPYNSWRSVNTAAKSSVEPSSSPARGKIAHIPNSNE